MKIRTATPEGICRLSGLLVLIRALHHHKDTSFPVASPFHSILPLEVIPSSIGVKLLILNARHARRVVADTDIHRSIAICGRHLENEAPLSHGSSHQAAMLPTRVHFRHGHSAPPTLDAYEDLHDPLVPDLAIVRLTPHAHVHLGFVRDEERSLQRVSDSVRSMGVQNMGALPSAGRRWETN